MLTVCLRKPLRNGESRSLTPTECADIAQCRPTLLPRAGKNWRVSRDDDGNLSLVHVTRRSGAASWALVQIPPAQSQSTIHLALSSPIAIGDRRNPSISELDEIFNSGIAVLPGSQLARESNAFLLLTCGKAVWTVQETIKTGTESDPAKPRLVWNVLSATNRRILECYF